MRKIMKNCGKYENKVERVKTRNRYWAFIQNCYLHVTVNSMLIYKIPIRMKVPSKWSFCFQKQTIRCKNKIFYVLSFFTMWGGLKKPTAYINNRSQLDLSIRWDSEAGKLYPWLMVVGERKNVNIHVSINILTQPRRQRGGGHATVAWVW